MSEIIASVYDLIEEDGAKEGILFLDGANDQDALDTNIDFVYMRL